MEFLEVSLRIVNGCLKFIPRGLPREQSNGGLTFGERQSLSPLGKPGVHTLDEVNKLILVDF